MEEKHAKSESKTKLVPGLISGLVTGICNGLFGAGGGMVAVLALKKICKVPAQEAHATAIIVMLPLTVVSIIVYLIGNAVSWELVPWTLPTFFVGGIVGAKLLGKLKSIWINRIFCAMMVIAGVWMII